MKKISIPGFLILLAVATGLLSAKFPAGGYQVGEKVKDFSLKNVDGKMVSLAGMKNTKGYIVIFTCNHCPFSVAYEDRIIDLHERYAPMGYPVVAINPNAEEIVPDDSYQNMIVRAKEKKFPFVYLQDSTQDVAKAFGALKTPHVFIVNKVKKDLVVEYIGAIDDNTDDPGAVKNKYVEMAMRDILANKIVQDRTTKAIGCSVKYRSN